CRSPLGFLMTKWREGIPGAFQMGCRHGAWCLGCCWALMCVLFVVGVMNLIWVAALTAFVLIEKLGPGGAIVARAAGAALVVLGLVALARRLGSSIPCCWARGLAIFITGDDPRLLQGRRSLAVSLVRAPFPP